MTRRHILPVGSCPATSLLILLDLCFCFSKGGSRLSTAFLKTELTYVLILQNESLLQSNLSIERLVGTVFKCTLVEF